MGNMTFLLVPKTKMWDIFIELPVASTVCFQRPKYLQGVDNTLKVLQNEPIKNRFISKSS